MGGGGQKSGKLVTSYMDDPKLVREGQQQTRLSIINIQISFETKMPDY